MHIFADLFLALFGVEDFSTSFSKINAQLRRISLEIKTLALPVDSVRGLGGPEMHFFHGITNNVSTSFLLATTLTNALYLCCIIG